MRRTGLVILCILLLGIAACREDPAAPTLVAATIAPTSTPLPPSPAPTTSTPAAVATAEPTAEPTVEPEPEAFCARVDPTLIELDLQGLPYEWQANCVAAVPFGSDGPMVGALPEHIQINFGGLSPSSRQPGDPVLYIIPADAYRALWEGGSNPLAGEQLDALQEWIGRQPAAVRPRGMPVLPLEEAQATNDLAVQGRYLDFGSWDGLRFVGRHSQGPSPITNEGLRYIFQGFTGDNDEYLVAFFYPVTTPGLPATIEEVTAEERAVLESDALGYFDEKAAALNALTAADWQPDLELLDALVGSLQYGGVETGAEAPPIEPDEGAGNPPSFAVVSGASGVNVRTGPSTAFPSLGVAPPGTQLELIGRSLDGQWWATPITGAPEGRGWMSAAFVEATNTAALPVMAAPAPPPTPTPLPAPPAEPSIAFWADRGSINQGECTTLRWSVSNIQAVWVYPAGEAFERHPVTGDGSRGVCPAQTTTYEMRVLLGDESVTTRQVVVSVNPGNPLAGSRWVLANFAGQPLAPGAPPTLFLGAGNHAEGFGGCNPFTAAYSVGAGGGLAMSLLTRGAMSCGPELDDQESRYLDALQGVGGYALSGDQLILSDTAGVETLRFFRR